MYFDLRISHHFTADPLAPARILGAMLGRLFARAERMCDSRETWHAERRAIRRRALSYNRDWFAPGGDDYCLAQDAANTGRAFRRAEHRYDLEQRIQATDRRARRALERSFVRFLDPGAFRAGVAFKDAEKAYDAAQQRLVRFRQAFVHLAPLGRAL